MYPNFHISAEFDPKASLRLSDEEYCACGQYYFLLGGNSRNCYFNYLVNSLLKLRVINVAISRCLKAK